ncbi:hypothetical protein C8Q77DRAFT_595105 [Trametes polyzona]|nr:hypothetical protein C8Q77DRAFT_595105 [Trametes polyzona]
MAYCLSLWSVRLCSSKHCRMLDRELEPPHSTMLDRTATPKQLVIHGVMAATRDAKYLNVFSLTNAPQPHVHATCERCLRMPDC